MVLHVALNHVTSYDYARPARLGPQIIRLRPAPHCRTPVLSYSLKLEPAEHFINWQQDPQGNFLARVVVPEPTRRFRIEVDLVANLQVINPFDFFLEETAEAWPFPYEGWLGTELKPFLDHPAPGPRLAAWLGTVSREKMRTIDFLVALNARLQHEVKYLIRLEPGVQTPEQTLERGSGSCRDSSWLLVQILRNLGLAARFVSGYLIQLKPDVASLDGPSGTDHDFTDLHAWAEAYLPGAGWFGLDPTSGLAAGEGHIPLAATPDPVSAAPISGGVEAVKTEFGFHMSVSRIRETPRVTKPYDDAQWRAIESMGHALDQTLKALDVRLTMGGEPTFVSIDDMDGAEWTTDAVGPTKRARADLLIRRLQARFAPDSLLHHGQGKWYPGEPLPRWAFSLFWRRDGVPLWRRPDLIAPETADHAPAAGAVRTFAEGVARRLDLAPTFVLDAYEDPAAMLVKEQMLPDNVDPFESHLEDPEERARLVRVFSRGLGVPAGCVLPVQPWQARAGGRVWRSEAWSLRRGRLFLMPGDSPVGFRLPLKALPWVPATDYPHVVERDPFDAFPDLPPEPDRTRQPYLSGAAGGGERQDITLHQHTTAKGAVRTAMAFEARDGRLCVFMPPVETLEDYLELLAVVEDTAAEMGLALHVEGYLPPKDPRLAMIQVTPDPGVIEVNIHPAGSWDELVRNTETLYEEARLSRLGTEKFLLDGRHTGTGGGNHLVLGGARAGDSPFLRRPDLLASLIAYWQNHPSLSYLFSGLFIGPTSQAPRLDEARHDSLYEMEIALRQVPDPAAAGENGIAPWLVDRLFRNLLIDVTGNTHRAEICIDKLYSPDGTAGRLGLVEFRAFEMPPHPRMSLAQQLLLRALVARFWETPYRESLVRWGTRLHDRFLLPRFVWQDFLDVLADLGRHGLPLKAEWFAPHREFRFPLYGTIVHDGVELELRQALEPWNVMGEQGAPGGTVRFVDSSVERLQVRVSGTNESRYAVACQGHAVPLAPTGVRGEGVAGVRFRAWQPPSCLHPTIGVHAPLVFDIVDTWSGRAVAGCTYHVAHPGGRAFETFPVNSYEAEGRRLARFFPFGHTPGPMAVAPAVPDADFPVTLDLRRVI